MSFLPITRKDMDDRGWEQIDFLFISGDAYVDHPSFGHAIITRLLESEGYRVGIIPQPDWHSIEDFKSMGCPKLAVLIASGVIDSMVSHYTASKKVRSNDQYSPGGKAGLRPDRAVMVYANKVREAFKDVPVIIGGIEASLRRFAHYDYWDDKVRRSILLDSKADMLIYGMGERPILELASLLKQGMRINEIKNLRGSVYVSNFEGLPQEVKEAIEGGNTAADTAGNKYSVLPSYEEVSGDKKEYAKGFKIQYDEQDAITGKTLIQKHGGRYLVQNPPALPLEVKELDRIYSLPYERTYHPVYEKYGGIPAIEEVQFSITSHRGCYGGCAFCALNFHQGRAIQSRSQASIINEAKKLTWLPNFKGYIHDVGGPTANFRKKACVKQVKSGVCKDRQCLHPEPCKNLVIDHSEYLSLLRKVRELTGIKKVFIRSGIRYDYLMLDKNDEFFNELCEHHVSGQLKVAPEHVVDRVLEKMGKPGRKVYERFVKKFYDINKRIGKEQYLVPYFISSHPGSDLKAAVELAEYLRDLGYNPEQVQDFYPTPGTLSTCMYYTGLDPRSMKPVYVPRSPREKAMQRALLQFRKRENHKLVYEALVEVGREDLIGFGRNCLIRPEQPFRGYEARGRTAKPGRDVRGRTAKPDREVRDKNARSNQGIKDKNENPGWEVKDKNAKPNQKVRGKNARPNKEAKGKKEKPNQGVRDKNTRPNQEVKGKNARPKQGDRDNNARPNKEVKGRNAKPNQGVRGRNAKPNQGVRDKNVRPNQEVKGRNAKPNKEDRGKNTKPNQEVRDRSAGQEQRTTGDKRVNARKG